jgi:hypothetical protein
VLYARARVDSVIVSNQITQDEVSRFLLPSLRVVCQDVICSMSNTFFFAGTLELQYWGCRSS